MTTWLAVFALSSSLSTANIPANPTWLDDYATAQQAVAKAHKPMAVFVGNGKDGWHKVVKDGGLTTEANKLLASRFVCVYVDTDTAAGKHLANVFDVANRGLIISDKEGVSQAYSLSGGLTRTELVQTLTKYGAADSGVRSTETVVREAPPSASRPVYVPQFRVAPRYSSGST